MTKRFWTAVAIAEHPAGFGVTLDGRPLRLPSGAALTLTTAPLAEAVAAEWRAAGGDKGGSFSAVDVPLTGLAGSAQERVRPHPAAIVDSLAAYAEADLLCYRAAQPDSLAAAQAAAWQPWLDWAARSHGATLHVTTGIGYVTQPAASLAALRAALARLSGEELAALGLAIPTFGSCVLGLALAARAIEPDEATRVALVDALFQEGRWGADAEATARREALGAEIRLAARFMALAR